MFRFGNFYVIPTVVKALGRKSYITQLRFMPLFWVGKPEQSRICYVSELLDTTQKLTTERTPIQTQNMHTHPSRKTQLAYAINICLCLKQCLAENLNYRRRGCPVFTEETECHFARLWTCQTGYTVIAAVESSLIIAHTLCLALYQL